jgi:transcriptional regulator with XRE-family HTH domain
MKDGDAMNTIATRLAIELEQQGISQSDLAEKIGRSKASISQYLSGKQIPTTEVCRKLEAVLGLPYGALETRVPAIPPQAKIKPEDVARALGTSPQTVRLLIQQGQYPECKAIQRPGSSRITYIIPHSFLRRCVRLKCSTLYRMKEPPYEPARTTNRATPQQNYRPRKRQPRTQERTRRGARLQGKPVHQPHTE